MISWRRRRSATREDTLTSRERGQVLPLFAVASVVLLGGAALLTDVAMWWTHELRMQRAADAGALAGAVFLPDDPATAFDRARTETSKNGFTHGQGGVSVTPWVDPVDPRKLLVDIDGPVGTNFARIFDLHTVHVSVVGAATYVLPVPMGSPQAYFGVGFFQGVDEDDPSGFTVLDVPHPITGEPLDSQGFWGAIFTPGGVRQNGDRYAPAYIGGANPPDGAGGGPNPNYDPNGYEYTIEIGGNGQVRLFDPVFCATGGNGSGGWLGAGDHWTTDGTGGGTTIGPVAVRFKLFDTNGTPYTSSDDTQVGSTLTYDPGSSTLGDFSGEFGRPQNHDRSDAEDCADHPAHNQWVLPSGWSGLAQGTYRLNVNTNLGSNANHGAENLFSVWVGGTGKARVYGAGRMAAYTNLDDTGTGGRQRFYLAQVDGVHARKTLRITLFDPGESRSPSWLRFLSPQGGTYDYTRFDWSSNDGRSQRNVDKVQTSTGSPLFDNRILTIDIQLPADYGDGGLDPNGVGEDGWWIVEYDVRAGNDTTTWEVKLLGNPVHLVLR